MRIGIDARFYGSVGKGLGRYTEKLIKYLEELDHANEYFIFLRKENFDEYQPSNTCFQKVLADYAWYSFDEQLRFPWLLRSFRLDLVHFPHFNVPLLYRGPFVVTIHDLILLHFPTRRATTLHPWWYRVKFWAYRMVIGHAVRKSRKIIAVSEYTRGDIEKYYPRTKGKIVVTYEAIEPFCYMADQSRAMSILSRLGLLTRDADNSSGRFDRGIIKPYLLYVGNAYPHKNLETLVSSLQRSDTPDIRLVLVGKEDYFYQRIQSLAREKHPERIIFAGFVPDNELDILYRFARAYVFPSLYEGFGLPPLEAMGRGLPVVAARATCLPEILGDAAYFFDPSVSQSFSQALARVWTDEALRKNLQAKGYERIQHFDWRVMAERTLQIYQDTA